MGEMGDKMGGTPHLDGGALFWGGKMAFFEKNGGSPISYEKMEDFLK